MKRTTLTVLAAAIGLAFGAAAQAEGKMTKSEHATAKAAIEADYKATRASCETSEGNAKDICEARAKGAERVALAELNATYKPSREARYEVKIVKADAVYALAIEECDEKAGNSKDVCVKEARAARTTSKADAKAHLKTVEAKQDAQVKIAKAHTQAATQITAAKDTAAADKRDASYAVATEKCDALSGDAKQACMTEAKSQYGKK